MAAAVTLAAGCSSTSPPEDLPWAGSTQAERVQSFTKECKAWDEWDKPAAPMQIFGNVWYVGTCGISAILITGDQGHILIDSGVAKAAPQVLANIRALGFRPRDVKYLLMSHEHFDHVGGHAAIVAATGATVIASEEAAAVLESGTVDPRDPQADARHPAMEPVIVANIVDDGDVVRLGDIAITAHTTPGHTPGALSWTWTACAEPKSPAVCRRIAYVDSLSAVSADSYRFADHPEALAAFRASFAKVASLPCDILLTPHPSSSGMIARLRDGGLDGVGQCADYAAKLSSSLDKRLAKEAADAM